MNEQMSRTDKPSPGGLQNVASVGKHTVKKERHHENRRVFVAACLLLGMASMALCDDANTPTTPKREKLQAFTRWVIVEEDWWISLHTNFSTHCLRHEFIAAHQERAASAEIDKAIAWLKFAINDADTTTAEDLSMARADLLISEALEAGEPVEARKPGCRLCPRLDGTRQAPPFQIEQGTRGGRFEVGRCATCWRPSTIFAPRPAMWIASRRRKWSPSIRITPPMATWKTRSHLIGPNSKAT